MIITIFLRAPSLMVAKDSHNHWIILILNIALIHFQSHFSPTNQQLACISVWIVSCILCYFRGSIVLSNDIGLGKGYCDNCTKTFFGAKKGSYKYRDLTTIDSKEEFFSGP